MDITFKQYGMQPLFGHEFEEIRRFLIDVNRDIMTNSNFLWARWEWAMSLISSYGGSREKNGVWYDGDKIVAFATNEVSLGKASFIIRPGYEFLKFDMLTYAIDALQRDGKMKILINDADHEFQQIAEVNGYCASSDIEKTLVLDLTRDLNYVLPYGYTARSLAEGYSLGKLNRCTYRGFDNGEEPETELTESYQGPNFDKRFHVVVETPEDCYGAYCGAWYDTNTDYVYIEPVCTDPVYRKKGLAKAALYEATKRCSEFGAKRAYVISQQQFYYNIGFSPTDTYTWWVKG